MIEMKKWMIGAIGLLCCLLCIEPCRAATEQPAQDLVLKNRHVELVFDGGKEYLFKAFRCEGRNMLPDQGSATHPWVLTYRGPHGENPALQPRWGFYDGGRLIAGEGESTLEFTWRVVLGKLDETWPVRVSVTLAKDSELPEWRLSAELPEGWVIVSSEFPRIAVRRPDDATGILSVGYGAEYPIGASGQLQSRYPSCTGAMQLVLMRHGEGTAYFAAKDTEGSGKIFRMVSEGSRLVFVQEVTASYGWSEGGEFSIPWPAVLGFSKEDWQATVLKWYRPFTFETEWGRRTIAERPIAEWIRQADMWLRPANATESMMEAVRKALKYYGKGVGMHWYYWHCHPFDTNYPDYFPVQPGFAEMIRESQKLGGFVTPYINGRLWDPATESYEVLNGKEASCRKPDGTLYTEVYGSKVLNTVTCPASEIWRDVLRDLNRRILKELKTDGVYMDQIGCASSEPCYATNHDHAPGGGDWWPKAYRSLLEGMRRDFYGKNKAMTTEENAECYIDLFDMMLVVNSPHTPTARMVPLFPLIYSDRCVYSGFTYIPWRINDGSLNYISMKSLLWGSQLGWIDPELLMRDDSKREAAFLKNLSEFRRGQHDLFLGGRFLGEFIPGGDNPTQDIPNYQITPVVMGAEWQSLRGEHVWLLVNMSDKARCVVLPDGREVTVAPFDAMRCNR